MLRGGVQGSDQLAGRQRLQRVCEGGQRLQGAAAARTPTPPGAAASDTARLCPRLRAGRHEYIFSNGSSRATRTAVASQPAAQSPSFCVTL